jgi:hypothetical protein
MRNFNVSPSPTEPGMWEIIGFDGQVVMLNGKVALFGSAVAAVKWAQSHTFIPVTK